MQHHYACLRGMVSRVKSYDEGVGGKEEQGRSVQHAESRAVEFP